MPFQNLNEVFTTQYKPNIQAKYSHKVSIGNLNDSEKTWYCKKMKNFTEAVFEIVGQEFFRLIIPHQPETKLLHDPKKNLYYILSEEVKGYKQIPDNPKHFTNGVYTGLGQVLVCAAFLQEIDLKNGNIGLDNQGRIIKIDGDWCFAQGRLGNDAEQNIQYNFTTETIDSFPYPKDFYAFNWLDIVKSGVKQQESLMIEPELSTSPSFRREINQALLKIMLTPDKFIENYINAIVPKGGQRLINFIKNKKIELRISAQNNTSFQEYLTTSQAETDANDLITHINSFITNNEKVIPSNEHSMISTEVITQLDSIRAEVKNKPIYSHINELLENLYDNNLGESIMIQYLDYLTNQLKTITEYNQLIEYESYLERIEEPDAKTTNDNIKTFKEFKKELSTGNKESNEQYNNSQNLK